MFLPQTSVMEGLETVDFPSILFLLNSKDGNKKALMQMCSPYLYAGAIKL
jgi:hypothetical protein